MSHFYTPHKNEPTESKLGLRVGDVFPHFNVWLVIQRLFTNGEEVTASCRDIRGAEHFCGFIPERVIKPETCMICGGPLNEDQVWTCRPICHSGWAMLISEELDAAGVEMETEATA